MDTTLYKIKQALNKLKFGNNTNLLDTISSINITEERISFIIYSNDKTQALKLKKLAEESILTLNLGREVIIGVTNENTTNKRKIILVSSGKGGVGKSTIAALIAQRLANIDKKNVGIVDADIYGPSLPTIFGLSNSKLTLENKRFIPLMSHGVKVMSIGFLINEEEALPWRGPMISKVISQLIFETNWGDLDYLIIDMPPGTGDIHITILQKLQIDSAIIVTTPQIISMKDTERTIILYKKFNININIIVENMVRDEHLNTAGNILAAKYSLLRQVIKLNPEIAVRCDNGQSLYGLEESC